mmetsp:Transcript_5259/g.13166  ORF Transcript_5259/g.13166 Transcript_5259/m.13166 type:complete len:244 (-) Transcript_5259:166-897(-)
MNPVSSVETVGAGGDASTETRLALQAPAEASTTAFFALSFPFPAAESLLLGLMTPPLLPPALLAAFFGVLADLAPLLGVLLLGVLVSALADALLGVLPLGVLWGVDLRSLLPSFLLLAGVAFSLFFTGVRERLAGVLGGSFSFSFSDASFARFFFSEGACFLPPGIFTMSFSRFASFASAPRSWMPASLLERFLEGFFPEGPPAANMSSSFAGRLARVVSRELAPFSPLFSRGDDRASPFASI